MCAKDVSTMMRTFLDPLLGSECVPYVASGRSSVAKTMFIHEKSLTTVYVTICMLYGIYSSPNPTPTFTLALYTV